MTVENNEPFDHIFRWKNNPVRAKLYGRRCRVLARGSALRSVLVEFEDGEQERVVTSARAIKRVK